MLLKAFQANSESLEAAHGKGLLCSARHLQRQREGRCVGSPSRETQKSARFLSRFGNLPVAELLIGLFC